MLGTGIHSIQAMNIVSHMYQAPIQDFCESNNNENGWGGGEGSIQEKETINSFVVYFTYMYCVLLIGFQKG